MAPKVKFQQQDARFMGQYQKRLFRTLHLAYKPFLGRISILLVFGFVGRFVILMNTNIIGYWVDSFCQSKECRPLPSWLLNWQADQYILTILLLCLTGFILTLFFRVGFSRLSAYAISRIYDEVTYRTSRYPMSFFDTTPVGRVITRFSSDYGNIFRLFGGPLAEFMALLFDLVVMIILMTVASPIYLVLVILIGLCNFGVYRRHKDQIRQDKRETSLTRAPSIAHFSETAQGASSIRTYLRQNTFLNKFQHLNNVFLNQRLKTFKTMTSFSFQISALTTLLLLITGISSYYLLKNQWVSVGSIGVAFTFITLSGNTVQSFFEWLTMFDEALVGAERLDHYLHLPIENGARLPQQTEFMTPHWTQTSPPPCLPIPKEIFKNPAPIEFHQVSFQYREDLPWVLKDISFTVKPGERLGIIGRTGSGKSSLIQTLFYLYPLNRGTISIHGFTPYLSSKNPPTATEINLDDYRRLITLIPQEPILFRGTLKENLALNQNHTEEDLWTSLQRIGLYDWAQSLPLKLDYPIEERGKNVSQGERQLLCMARALLQDSPVVVLDEATSAVDPQSEQIMIQATQNFFAQRTQLIIAHRLSTLENCDRILWIHKGEIRQLGKPKEVLLEFLKNHKSEVII